MGFSLSGLMALSLLSLFLWVIKYYLNQLTMEQNYLIILSILNILSAALFFSIVGHDEVMRHQTQNIPFYLLLFISLFSHPKINQNTTSCENIVSRSSITLRVFVGLFIAISFFAMRIYSVDSRVLDVSFCGDSSLKMKIIDKTQNPFYKETDYPLTLPVYNWVPQSFIDVKWEYLYKIRINSNGNHRNINVVSNLIIDPENISSVCLLSIEDSSTSGIGHYYALRQY